MEEWGWNPSTFQAVGAVSAFWAAVIAISISIYFNLRAVRIASDAANAAKQQAETTARQVTSRERPWLALTGVEYKPAIGTGLMSRDELLIRFSNFGTLPPSSPVNLEITFRPHRLDGDDETLVPLTFAEELGVIFPDEPSDHRFVNPHYSNWRFDHRIVEVSGKFNYQFFTDSFKTEFSIMIDSQTVAGNQPPNITWQNTRGL